MGSWLIHMNESRTHTPNGIWSMSWWLIHIIHMSESFIYHMGSWLIWFIWTSHQLAWMRYSFICALTHTRTGGAPFRYLWIRNVWVRDSFVHMNSWLIHPYESVTHSCIWVRESFFLSWVANTQLHHWTKRVVSTLLITDPRNYSADRCRPGARQAQVLYPRSQPRATVVGPEFPRIATSPFPPCFFHFFLKSHVSCFWNWTSIGLQADFNVWFQIGRLLLGDVGF